MPNDELREYSLKLAALAVDALVEEKLVAEPECSRAVTLAALELYVRFSMNDLPPDHP
jgi:hypothetical protein